jgi:outer membrane protein OmpA-like peptidoglycan-associated protein
MKIPTNSILLVAAALSVTLAGCMGTKIDGRAQNRRVEVRPIK